MMDNWYKIKNATIRDKDIQNAIDICKCPEPMLCTVATTCYEQHERERMCLKCWLDWCDKNGVEIDYGKV